jgi:uncharacterized protein YaaR (DUF327 family)
MLSTGFVAISLKLCLNLPKSRVIQPSKHYKGDLMRIAGAGGARISPRNNRVIVIRNDAPSLFSRELARKEEKILDLDRMELEDLRDELQGMGENFEKEPNIANFRVFRELIGRFARKATSLAYRVEKMKSNGPDRILEIVAIIDRSADELYHLVMEGQRDRFFIASRIANINGMIVSLSA